MKTLRLSAYALIASCALIFSASSAMLCAQNAGSNSSASCQLSMYGNVNYGSGSSILDGLIHAQLSGTVNLFPGTLALGNMTASLPLSGGGILTGDSTQISGGTLTLSGAGAILIKSGTWQHVSDLLSSIHTLFVTPPRTPYLIENQTCSLYASVNGSSNSSVLPQADSYQWKISTNNGSTWRDIGSNADDIEIFSSGTENPFHIFALKTDMTGWQFKATASVADGSQQGTLSLTSPIITLQTIKPSHLKSPSALAIDASNNLYVADPLTNAIWKIFDGNKAAVLAGSAMGESGMVNATGTLARFYHPQGIALHAGKLYVADTGNHAIRVIDANGAVTTLAGQPGVIGYQEGTGTNAQFYAPSVLAVDANGNVYVADSGNNVIRKITPAGVTSHVAGNKYASGGSISGGAINVSSGGFSVDLTNWAGSGTMVFSGSTKLATGNIVLGGGAIFNTGPLGDLVLGAGTLISGSYTLTTSTTISVDSFGNYANTILTSGSTSIYFSGNIYRGSTPLLNSGTTPAPQAFEAPVEPAPYYFNSTSGITLSPDGTYLYVADSGNDTLCKIKLSDGSITTLSINITGLPTDGNSSYSSSLWIPSGLRFDKNNNLYIADTYNCRIVKLTPSGDASVISGRPAWYTFENPYNDGSADEALFCFPSDIAIDNTGNLYVADTENAAIRQISQNTSSVTVSTVGLMAAPFTTPTTPNAAPTTNNSGSGGGGGAPSAWYLLVFGALVSLRLRRR